MENTYAESDFWVAAATVSSALIIAISIFAKSLVSLIEDDANRGLENKTLRRSAKLFSILTVLVGLSNCAILFASLDSLKNRSSAILPTSVAAPLLAGTFCAFAIIVIISGLMEIWKPINNHPGERDPEASLTPQNTFEFSIKNRNGRFSEQDVRVKFFGLPGRQD